MEELKIYKLLPIPEETAWDRDYKWYQLYSKFQSWLYCNYQYNFINKKLDKYIFTPITNINEGFANFKLWHKTIWKDRNWDGTYILEILQRKIEIQRMYLVSNNRHQNIFRDNFYMTASLNLLERVKTEWYTMEYYDYYKSDFSFKPTFELFFNPITKKDEETFTMETTVISENLDDYLNLYPKATKIVRAILEKERDTYDKHYLAMRVGDYNHEKATKLLYKIFETQMACWWD